MSMKKTRVHKVNEGFSIKLSCSDLNIATVESIPLDFTVDNSSVDQSSTSSTVIDSVDKSPSSVREVKNPIFVRKLWLSDKSLSTKCKIDSGGEANILPFFPFRKFSVRCRKK